MTDYTTPEINAEAQRRAALAKEIVAWFRKDHGRGYNSRSLEDRLAVEILGKWWIDERAPHIPNSGAAQPAEAYEVAAGLVEAVERGLETFWKEAASGSLMSHSIQCGLHEVKSWIERNKGGWSSDPAWLKTAAEKLSVYVHNRVVTDGGDFDEDDAAEIIREAMAGQ